MQTIDVIRWCFVVGLVSFVIGAICVIAGQKS